MVRRTTQSKSAGGNSGLTPFRVLTRGGNNPICVPTPVDFFNIGVIPLTQGKFAIVDNADLEELSSHKWYALKHPNNRWYAVRDKYLDGERTHIRMHRQLMKATKGQEIDHRNRDGLFNCRCNLRFCTRSQNNSNQQPKEGTSKYKGIYWHKPNKKWIARIKLNQKHYYLGSFVNEVEAAKAYDEKAKELFGEFARTNF